MEAISSSPAPPWVRPGTIAVGAALAAVTAVGMSAYVRFEVPLAVDAHGETALLAWVLIATAGLAALLCAYLALIWSLTSLVQLVGPASRLGKALVSTLRVIAPRVARRLTLGAAVATTATGLALVPASAADQAADQQHSGQISVAATLTSTAPLPTGGDEAAPSESGSTSDASGTESDDPGSGHGESVPEDSTNVAPRPGLGWSDAPLPGSDAARDEGHPTVPGAAADPGAAPQSSPQSPSTVDVQPGDSLWSITDDLLGPDADHPDDISALWPSLHAVNSDVIGPDPDHLEPGQVLVVPADLSPQEQS